MNGSKVVTTRDRATGQTHTFAEDEILIAAGRRSNADLLHPEHTGVKTDERGWIFVSARRPRTGSGFGIRDGKPGLDGTAEHLLAHFRPCGHYRSDREHRRAQQHGFDVRLACDGVCWG